MDTTKVKVKKITKIDSGSKRYDIETQKNHCFFANNVLVHNSQFILAHEIETEKTIVSSKGMLKSGLSLQEEGTNTYWIAAKNCDVISRIRQSFDSGVVQVFGEVIPVQKGFSYGQSKPVVKLFDVRVNGVSIPYDMVPENLLELWVPIVFDGSLNLIESEVVIYTDPERGIHKTKVNKSLPQDVIDMCKDLELVSGQGLHIREGVVLRPYLDRDSTDGTKLRLKIINPSYKESGEEFN
jgi:hypothetical protein